MSETSSHSLTASKMSFDNGVQVAWDATSLDLWQTCPRKYYYSMIRGVKPKGQSVHLLFGGLYASALEQFYKLRATGSDIDQALRETVRTALTDSWDSETNQPMEFEHASKTRVGLIRTLVWYVEQFAIETEDGVKTYHLQSGKPAVELSFTLDMTPDLMYCGHLDRVVEYGEQLFVMDQKTTGSTLGTYYFNGFKPNNQMSGYSFAGQVVLHSPVSGVIIDAAQIMANATRFERGVTTRSKQELDEWFSDTISTIQFAQHQMAAERFPMNPNSCGNYGGCPFRQLCGVSPSVRENYIKSDFTSHNWDPLRKR